jgi:hypothetical protein
VDDAGRHMQVDDAGRHMQVDDAGRHMQVDDAGRHMQTRIATLWFYVFKRSSGLEMLCCCVLKASHTVL